jgi:DNA processing protein
MNKKITGRMIVTFLAVKYENDWDSIYSAIKSKEYVDKSIIAKTLEKIQGEYVCIIDSDYPDTLKKLFKPPFVVFLDKDDRDIINDKSSKKYLKHFDLNVSRLGA